MDGKVLFLRLVLIAGILAAAGCSAPRTPAPVPTPDSAASASPSVAPSNEPGLTVAFVKDGNIQMWNESTGQIQTIVNTGDVIAVSTSDDGQVIAFLRRSAVQLASGEGIEQSALWAVDRSGGDARELVSAESLRQRLKAGERDSINVPQMEWIPGTHRLLFSGWKYIVIAEGESHAVPEGLYLVDTDSRTDSTLIASGNNLRFAPSPDGGQVALMSSNSLGFINVDGSNLRPDVLTYPSVGTTAPVFPEGVWTQDSRAFVITGSFENTSSGINFTVWRAPVDGSAPESLAKILNSDPASIAFSPDGKHMASVQFTEAQPSEIAGWLITPLTPEAGSLAIPTRIGLEGLANVHWSPTGDPFTRNLQRLCLDAARDSDVCDVRIHFDGTLAAVQWIDGNRILFLTRNPSVLFLGRMDFTSNMDGTTLPIMAWPLEDQVSAKSFTIAPVSQ